MENTTRIQEVLERKAKIVQDGGPQRVQKQHAAGKLTARERLGLLFNPDTFQEYDISMEHRCHDFGMKKVDTPAEGTVTGYGLVNGCGVFAFTHDFTTLSSAMGEMQGMKVKRIQELALDAGVPFVGLNDSGDGRIQEGPTTSYGVILYNNVMASGVIPQISAVMDPYAGGTTYSPALIGFVFSVDRTGRSFLTSPSVIKNVTSETVDEETLGGARTHNILSGVSHYFCEDDVDCIEQIKVPLSYLPLNYQGPSSAYSCTDAPNRHCEMLSTFIPDNERKTYNIKDIILEIADSHDFFERQAMYATNIIAGFIRVNEKSVGTVASQPQSLADCIDTDASDKAARFIHACDCFNIPLLSIVSVPDLLPGIDQEFGGIIRHGAKMLYAWSRATAPKIVVATGKVIGGAHPAMCSQELHPDIVFAWPSAQTTMVDTGSAVDICREEEPKTARKAGEDVSALRRQYIEEYTREFVNPHKAAELGKFEDVVEPAQSRHIIIRALEMFHNKKVALPARKCGNIPL